MIAERLTAAPSAALRASLADRYRLERELGQGGMATVYLAEDLKHKRNVALKVLRPELAAVLGAERFVQEITTTAALQHPHILPLFDSGSADGFLYYVMPFIDSETLRSKLDRETQLGVDEAVRIASDVASALHYAHQHGVIHRDIKPENILLHDGRPMVADFGIALALSAAAGGRMTETGLSLGTPHYMSPEQATAEKEITGRSDVYSLGSVLYEMLAGQPPHLGGSAQQIIMKIIAEGAAPITRLRKSVPPNVAAAVAKSLEKLPLAFVRRDGHLMVVPFDLKSLSLRGTPVAVLDSVSTEGPVPYFAVSASGTAVMRLGAAAQALGFTLVRVDRSGRETALDSSWTFRVTQFAGNFGWSASPDGSRLAIGLNTREGDDIWVKPLPRGPATRVTFGAGPESRPRWTPDGRSLTFVSPDGLSGGPVLRLGEPTPLFRLREGLSYLEARYSTPWDVGPDGQFIMARSVDGATGAGTPLVVVENWFEEVKAKVKR